MNPTSNEPPDIDLQQLLNRHDIWRGDLRSFISHISLDTGYPALNVALFNNGWPTQTLVEVCQRGLQQQEWLLFSSVLSKATGYIVLLNPPAMPFCQALIQADIDLERVIIVQVKNKADFLASFVELTRTESCAVLLAWQQHQTLTYTELRKCLLASNEGSALCVLFRSENAQQQSSPAALRLTVEVRSAELYLRIFKQKGALQQPEPISLPLPKAWKGFLPYHLLDNATQPLHSNTSPAKRKSAAILAIKREKR